MPLAFRFLAALIVTTSFYSFSESEDPASPSVHPSCVTAVTELVLPAQFAQNSFHASMEHGHENWQKNWSDRGFFHALFPRTPENEAIAFEKYGFKWWYTNIFFVKSVEEII